MWGGWGGMIVRAWIEDDKLQCCSQLCKNETYTCPRFDSCKEYDINFESNSESFAKLWEKAEVENLKKDLRIKKLEEALQDFAYHGTRADLDPTRIVQIDKHEPEADIFYRRYLKRIDDYVRERAKQALDQK